MVNRRKRYAAVWLVFVLALTMLLGCKVLLPTQSETPNGSNAELETPKYVFLFIGDGMSYAQVGATEQYLSAMQNTMGVNLNFTEFEVTGCMEIYDSTSSIPDSASSGTAIATGEMTTSGRICMDNDGMVSYPSIAKRLKEEKGYRIGIVSTVYLNHATPAVFYAHQPSRSMYYDIGLDLIDSEFDYFGGGGLYNVDNSGKSENLYMLAEASGYAIADTREKAEALKKADGKAIVVAPVVDDDTITVPYRMDASASDWTLADYVQKGIEMIDNDMGFFMMVESGKIDWACHANDSNAIVSEVLALSDAVAVAIEFYNRHPDETLILVTADHETGGMSLGNASMGYVLHPEYLQKQTMSFTSFNNTYIPTYKEDCPSFDTVLDDIEIVFGLVAKKNATNATDSNLIMTDAEYKRLKDAYEATLDGKVDDPLYGSYEPLTVTANHILNDHIGIAFSSYVHTAAPVPVYAHGVGCHAFTGVYHSTELNQRLAVMLDIDTNNSI